MLNERQLQEWKWGATLGTVAVIKLEIDCGCMKKKKGTDSRDVLESKSIGFGIKWDEEA